MVFLQDGESVAIVVQITVVERDDDRIGREFCAIFPAVDHFRRGNRMIAILCQILHLMLELIRVDCQGVLCRIVDLMVVDDRDSAGWLLPERAENCEQHQQKTCEKEPQAFA